jgi:HK97 gp10 family phage protein
MAGEVRWYENQVLAEIDKIKRSALRKIGNAVAADAKALCPISIEIKSGNKVWKEREPGTLRASIRVYVRKNGNSVQVIAGSRKALVSKGGKKHMGRDPFYARFVEFGTSRMMAFPFLRPAMKRNFSKVLAAFTNQLK